MSLYRSLVQILSRSMALFVAAGVAVLGVLTAGGYGLYRFFSRSRGNPNHSTLAGQSGYRGVDEERRGLVESASASSESEADFSEASSEEQPEEKHEECIVEQGDEEAVAEQVKPGNFEVAAVVAEKFPILLVAEEQQQNEEKGAKESLLQSEVAASPKMSSCSAEVESTQSESEEQVVAVTGSSQQPPTVDTSVTESGANKSEKVSAQILPNASQAAEHSGMLSSTLNTSHLSSFSSSPPVAPKPKSRSHQVVQKQDDIEVAMTPTTMTTSPREKLRSPNAVLVMPKGLAEHIALRSPGGVRGNINQGNIATPESLPNAKRPKLTPPGSVRVMPMDMSPLSGRQWKDGGELGMRVVMNGVMSDHQEHQEAVSFDEPTQAPKLTFPSRNKGPSRRPPTTHQ